MRLFEGVSAAGLIDGDETTRGYLATLSVGSFLENPWFGMGPVTMSRSDLLFFAVGGHCSWLDQLAEYGLVGFSPFLIFCALGLRGAMRSFGETRSLVDGAFVATILVFIVCGWTNPAVFIESISAPLAFLCGSFGSFVPAGRRVRAARDEPLGVSGEEAGAGVKESVCRA
jgi:O-antigen ligase